MKKFLTSIVVLLLLVSCCLIAAFPTSASDVNYEDWDIIDGVILEYLGEDPDVVVPAVDEDGNPITRIDSRAFLKNTNIQSVVISEGIETVGNEVFQYCENLKEASLPYSLKETGYSMFARTDLYSLVIPGQLKRVRHDTGTCANLSRVIISSGVEELEYSCFYGIFEELVLPKSVIKAEGYFRPGLKQSMSKFELYILNPNISLGENNPKASHGWYDSIGPIGPTSYGYEGCKTAITVYSLDNSPVEEYVNTYMIGKVPTNDGNILPVTFKAIDQAKIDALEAENLANSITGSKGSDSGDDTGADGGDDTGADGEDNTGTDVGDNTGTDGSNSTGTNNNNNNNAGNNNNGTNNATSGGNDTTVIIILAVVGGVILLLIIAAVVVVIIVLNGKKKKKKKAAKVEEPEEAVVVEETAVEEVTEENGEE